MEATEPVEAPKRQPYATDLTDAQWEKIEPLFRPATNGRTGRGRLHSRRDILDAIFYQLRTGWFQRGIVKLLTDFQPDWGQQADEGAESPFCSLPMPPSGGWLRRSRSGI